MTPAKEKQIDHLIAELSEVRVGNNALNQYSLHEKFGELRRNNLKLYLHLIDQCWSKMLLIGEAVSYQGGRHTGIAFTSEYLILHGVPELNMFMPGQGFQVANEFNKVWREPSATIIWGTFAQIGMVPLLWNAFPFHPHKPGVPFSNRTPTDTELETGRPFMKEIIDIFEPEVVVAVGNSSANSLIKLGIEHTKVRHPAHGGKHKFVGGINEILKKLWPGGNPKCTS